MTRQDKPKDYQYEYAGVYYKIRWLAGKDRVFRWTNGSWVASNMATHELRRYGKLKGSNVPDFPAVDDENLAFLRTPPETSETKPRAHETAAATTEPKQTKPKLPKRDPEHPDRLPNGTPVLVSHPLKDTMVGEIAGADRFTTKPETYYVKTTDGVCHWITADRITPLAVKPQTRTTNNQNGDHHAA